MFELVPINKRGIRVSNRLKLRAFPLFNLARKGLRREIVMKHVAASAIQAVVSSGSSANSLDTTRHLHASP